MRRIWGQLIEMSGVAPTHSSGSQPSIVRPHGGFPQHRSSLEEHGMHERGKFDYTVFYYSLYKNFLKMSQKCFLSLCVHKLCGSFSSICFTENTI